MPPQEIRIYAPKPLFLLESRWVWWRELSNSGDPAPLAVWLEDYSLGQLWEKNEIGGRPGAESNMAQTTKTQQSRLIPSPKVLQKALAQSARQAQRMADAFGLTVPTVKTKAAKNTRTTG